ncbi:vomeronasal type-1 receptor 4-like [Camelus bactrianus]|uniref:Vomeronasal type-1 receptor 4-like n=1 Tax=Camelus bactrianus TaxID=9837 RepID=A0AC58QWF1_CAMBA
MLNDRIYSRDLTVAIISLSQTVVGVLGNFSLLYRYLFLYHTECRLRATDLILKHLTIANSLILLSRGVPHTMAAFGLKYFFNDFACRLVLYVQRVSRGVSIATTCFLSVFQAIMISPMDSCWKNLRVKAPQNVGFCIFLVWIQFTLVNLINPIYVLHMSSKWSMKNITKIRNWGHCFITDHGQITRLIHAGLVIVPEVSFSVVMTWASGSMVFILYRHNQWVQHIHRRSMPPRSSAESTATRRILALVSTFVAFYTLPSLFHLCVALFPSLSLWVMSISTLISVCFPTVSPCLFMSHDSTVPRLSFAWIRNSKSFKLVRNM